MYGDSYSASNGSILRLILHELGDGVKWVFRKKRNSGNLQKNFSLRWLLFPIEFL